MAEQKSAANPMVILVVGGLAIVSVVLLQIFGKSKEDKEQDKDSKELQKWWNKYMNDSILGTIVKKSGYNKSANFLSEPKKYAALLVAFKDAKGTFNDNEDSLFSLFRNIPTIFELYYCNRQFREKYKVDLLSYLEGFTNTAEQAKIYNLMKDKPLYKVYQK